MEKVLLYHFIKLIIFVEKLNLKNVPLKSYSPILKVWGPKMPRLQHLFTQKSSTISLVIALLIRSILFGPRVLPFLIVLVIKSLGVVFSARRCLAVREFPLTDRYEDYHGPS